MTVYLEKSSDDVLSHCRCEQALVTYPAQLDCPWCGCGWLFSCLDCRKAFMFARGIETDRSLRDIAAEDLLKRSGKQPTPAKVREWVGAMEDLLSDVIPGQEYVYLDGAYLPATFGAVELQGWYANHRFRVLPQVASRSNAQAYLRDLSREAYWRGQAPDPDA